jgi:tetratricopeptide (TPR) repeat protein
MILRPIAWCSYVTGKFETALKYYKKLIDNGEASYFDYLNLGHTYWCSNQVENATEIYKKSLEMSKNQAKSIKKDFIEDKEYLLLHGIKEFEIELMIDYLSLDTDILNS